MRRPPGPTRLHPQTHREKVPPTWARPARRDPAPNSAQCQAAQTSLLVSGDRECRRPTRAPQLCMRAFPPPAAAVQLLARTRGSRGSGGKEVSTHTLRLCAATAEQVTRGRWRLGCVTRAPPRNLPSPALLPLLAVGAEPGPLGYSNWLISESPCFLPKVDVNGLPDSRGQIRPLRKRTLTKMRLRWAT